MLNHTVCTDIGNEGVYLQFEGWPHVKKVIISGGSKMASIAVNFPFF